VGGTESNIFALWVARNYFQQKFPNTLIQIVAPWCDVTHYSIFKALNLLGLTFTGSDGYEHSKSPVAKLHYVPIGADGYPDYSKLSNELDNLPTIFIINAPSINTGLVDNIPNKIKELYKKGTIIDNNKIWAHVDGAFGMFFLPFLEENDYKQIGDPIWTFYQTEKPKLGNLYFPHVKSISVDLHKMGLIPYPAGVILINEKNGWKYIERMVGYIAGHSDNTLLGSRPGAAVTSAYAAIKELGYMGYKEIIVKSLKLTNKFLEYFNQFDEVFEIVGKPITNVFAIKFKQEFINKLKDNIRLQEIVKFWWIKRCVKDYTIVDTSLKVGFLPPDKQKPKNKKESGKEEKNYEGMIWRFVIMPHVTDKVFNEFKQALYNFIQEVRYNV